MNRTGCAPSNASNDTAVHDSASGDCHIFASHEPGNTWKAGPTTSTEKPGSTKDMVVHVGN